MTKENEENEEHETNQHLIGMKELFRGHDAKAWKGVDFSRMKYKELNKIVVVKCVECYVKCWKHRNECVHDEDKKRKRVIEWHENVNNRIGNSEMTQLKMDIRKIKINLQ